MSRARIWVVGAALLLFALQVVLLVSWTQGGQTRSEPDVDTRETQQQIEGAREDAQQLQKVHVALQSRADHLDQVIASGTDAHQPPQEPIQDLACIGSAVNSASTVAAVVVLAYIRVEYLRQCMTSVLEVHGQDSANRQKFPLHISQDGNHSGVAELARSYAPSATHMQHIEADNFPTRKPNEAIAYYRIASHYAFVMQQIFDCWQYPKLIILEDDMRLSVDFFTFFEMGAKLLDSDSSLYCISSWNDHGQAQFVHNSSRLERSDFFPGLGWMLTNDLWQSLKNKWPAAYWDDWMRLRTVRNGRQCIRPEVCRTYNFGEKGSSNGQYYHQFLKPIKLNDIAVDWQTQDLHYIQPKPYAHMIGLKTKEAKLLESADDIKLQSGTVKLMYDGRKEYELLADELGIISDWKDGVPRAGYHGIVTLHMHNIEVMLVPVPVVEKALRHRRVGKPDKITRIL